MLEIIDYNPELKEHIKTLNVEWIQKYFELEPIDIMMLSNPEEEIVSKGGLIFYATHREEVVGTVSLLPVQEGVYELCKMAVSEKHQGLGAGKALMEHCIEVAKEMKLHKIILYTNSQLAAAIHLYKKYGFVEVAMEDNHYVRADILMEKEI